MGFLSHFAKSDDKFEQLPELLERPMKLPIGLFSEYIHDKPIALAVHEKYLTWNQDKRYTITDAITGEPALLTSFRFWSSMPKEILTPSGEPLFNFSQRIFALQYTFDGVIPKKSSHSPNPSSFSLPSSSSAELDKLPENDPEPNKKDVLFTVKSPGSCFSINKVVMKFRNPADGQDMEIMLHEDTNGFSLSSKRKGIFTLESHPLKPVLGTLTPEAPTFLDPSRLATPRVGHSWRYYIIVAPGVDAALLCALCLCIDQVRVLTRSGGAASSAAAAASAAAVA